MEVCDFFGGREKTILTVLWWGIMVRPASRSRREGSVTCSPEAVPERKYGILHPTRQSVLWRQMGRHRKFLTQNKTPSSLQGYRRFFSSTTLFVGGLAFLFSVCRPDGNFRARMLIFSIREFLCQTGGVAASGVENRQLRGCWSLDNAVAYLSIALILPGSDWCAMRHSIGEIQSGRAILWKLHSNFIWWRNGTHGGTLNINSLVQMQVFIEKKTFSVIINASQSHFLLTVLQQQRIINPFTYHCARSSGDKPLRKFGVRVRYPSGYVFQSSLPAPISGNNVAELGRHAQRVPSRSFKSKKKGKLIGEQDDEKYFGVMLRTPENNWFTRCSYATIQPPWCHRTTDISEIFFIGNDSKIPMLQFRYGSAINGTISWTNNAALQLQVQNLLRSKWWCRRTGVWLGSEY